MQASGHGTMPDLAGSRALFGLSRATFNPTTMLTKVRVFFQIQIGLLFKYGWLMSWWKNKPVDRHGNPLPWITYPAIDFIKQFDYSDADVFEWGSGYSTLWWSQRCRSIHSLESNPQWYSIMKSRLGANVTYIHTAIKAEDEVAAFRELKRDFDVIVLDNHGSFRYDCAKAAAEALREGGMIILDNSDQCVKTTRLLRDAGFVQIDFSGFAPSNGYAHTTSVFFRNRLRFETKDGVQPHSSVAQPNPVWEDC